MDAETQHRTPLTKHQQRVLAALLALEQVHKWNWWGRDAIGNVVGAGGFHRTIQRATMFLLHERCLVIRQAETWSEDMRAQVRCPCASTIIVIASWMQTTAAPPLELSYEIVSDYLGEAYRKKPLEQRTRSRQPRSWPHRGWRPPRVMCPRYRPEQKPSTYG